MEKTKRGLNKKYKDGDKINGREILKAYADKMPGGQYKHLFECECGRKFLCSSGNIKKGNGCGCRRWKADPGNPVLKIQDGDVFGTMEVQIAYVMKGKNYGMFHAVRCLECDSRKVVRTDKLRRKTKCNCDGTGNRKHKVKTGEIYGSWKVIKTYVGKNGREWKHLCRCECGVTRKLSAWSLTHSLTSRCVDCAGKRRRSVSPAMHVLRRYKNSARERGIEFRLSVEDFSSMIVKDCDYCGCKPKQRRTSGPEPFKFNGIDRVDSSKGYESSNCAPCCPDCNFMKLDKSKDQFLRKVEEIYNKNRESYAASQWSPNLKEE